MMEFPKQYAGEYVEMTYYTKHTKTFYVPEGTGDALEAENQSHFTDRLVHQAIVEKAETMLGEGETLTLLMMHTPEISTWNIYEQ